MPDPARVPAAPRPGGSRRAGGAEALALRAAASLAEAGVTVSPPRVADGFFSRLRGLMFRRDMERGEALLITRCGAVHTCFMRFPLDVFFLDGGGEVVRVARNVRPWRLCVWGGRAARMAVEIKSRGSEARPAAP